jgi:sec-independent protein translocase protein TatA
MSPLFAWGLSPTEILILLVLGVLLFGRRLPEVGRSLGKGIVEFKKGLKGLEDEIETNTNAATRQEPTALEPPRPPQRVATNVPKFEEAPPTPPQS